MPATLGPNSMTLHAMMTLNLCLESYAAAVHLMDSLLASGVYLGGHYAEHADEPDAERSVELQFETAVRRAAEALPFELAHAVWLVDVCNCSYDQVAVELGITRSDVTALVVDARRSIRSAVVAEPVATPVR